MYAMRMILGIQTGQPGRRVVQNRTLKSATYCGGRLFLHHRSRLRRTSRHCARTTIIFSLHQRPPPAGQCGHHHTTIFADDCLIYCQIKSPKTRTSVNVISNPWRSGPKYGACASTLPSAQSSAPIAPRSPLFVSTLCVEKSCLNPRRPSTLIGVVISSDLLWEKQVNAISQKASNTLNFIRRNLKYCPQEAKTIAYNSLVRSTVEYCTSAWDPIMPRTLTRASESTGGLQDSFLETTARGAVSLPCSPNWAGSP